jgi:hypothetical protein
MRYIIREKFFRLTEDSVIQDDEFAHLNWPTLIT